MMKRVKKLLFIVAAVSVILHFVHICTEKQIPYISENDSGEIVAHFLDVGQADSTFIELPNGETMLVDAGNTKNGAQIIKYIKSLNYTKIDYLVATHPHADHIGGMTAVINSLKIGRLYMTDKEATTRVFENLLDAVEANNTDVRFAVEGMDILNSDNLKITILSPRKNEYNDLNNSSLVVKITYENTEILFTGDINMAVENNLLNADIESDILKVSHHGSNTASSDKFISAVSPKTAVISCGEKNSYGHPSPQVLGILESKGIELYRTDTDGTIIISADGNENLTVKTISKK